MSLNGKLGEDDMFSSDLSDDQLTERLSAVHVPCLVAMSMEDEYMPSFVDKALNARRIAAAVGGEGTVALIEGADHSLYKGTQQFLEKVQVFLAGL